MLVVDLDLVGDVVGWFGVEWDVGVDVIVVVWCVLWLEVCYVGCCWIGLQVVVVVVEVVLECVYVFVVVQFGSNGEVVMFVGEIVVEDGRLGVVVVVVFGGFVKIQFDFGVFEFVMQDDVVYV